MGQPRRRGDVGRRQHPHAGRRHPGGRLGPLLLHPLLADLAQVPPAPAQQVPDAQTRVADLARYEGRFANRPTRIEISSDGDGRLWQTRTLQNDEIDMARRAGIATTVTRYEIRPIGFDTFVRVSSTEKPAGTIAFFDPDAAGRCTVVADDRVAMRHR